MQTALRVRTAILPGSRIEIADPCLPEGADVDVIVLVGDDGQPSATEPRAASRARSIFDLVDSLPASPSPQ